MALNVTRGMFRLWVVLSVLWLVGMGWHQYRGEQRAEDSSFTISLNKDSAIRIDASGIKQENTSDEQIKKIGLLVLPPLVLLLFFPVGVWLARGFKSSK